MKMRENKLEFIRNERGFITENTTGIKFMIRIFINNFFSITLTT